MKSISDILQVLLLAGGAVGLICWMLTSLVFWQAVKLLYVFSKDVLMFAFKWLHRVTISPGGSLLEVFRTLVVLLCVAVFLNAFRVPIVDTYQHFEQTCLFPVCVNEDTSFWVLQAYEEELKKKVSEYEFEVVKRETRRTALAVGCSPLAIYEVAYSECGLDPFAANVDEASGDTVAYGWIQFTRAGCVGTKVQGKPINMSEVKSWGRSHPRNIQAMMEATHSYLLSRAKGSALPTATEVYTAVFAPAMIGHPEDVVLYSKAGPNPKNYLENAGLDGYGVDGGKILKSRKYTDGKITKADMRLHLALKRSIFLKTKK